MTKDDEVVLQAIEDAYSFYAQELKQMVDMVEMHYDAIPDGMLSEIRSMTGHMCDATIRKNEPLENRVANVNSAVTHMRRIYLDCYKLMCIWFRNYIKKFHKKYFFLDWQSVTDGDFIRKFSALEKDAKNNYKKAKDSERPGKNDRDKENNLGEVYLAYMEAFNSYIEIVDYIEENEERVERAAHNDHRKTVISFLGWIIGIIATIICTYVTLH